MMSGFCVFMTRARMESESWLTASAMVSRRRLRATFTTGSPDSIRTRKPLSALVTWIITSISWSSSSAARSCAISFRENSKSFLYELSSAMVLRGCLVGGRLVVERELDLIDAETDPVLVREAVLLALLAVDVELGVAVGGGEVEVAPVEVDVRVALGQQRVGQGDVGLVAAAERGDLLVDVVDLHALSGDLHPERRHGWVLSKLPCGAGAEREAVGERGGELDDEADSFRAGMSSPAGHHVALVVADGVDDSPGGDREEQAAAHQLGTQNPGRGLFLGMIDLLGRTGGGIPSGSVV